MQERVGRATDLSFRADIVSVTQRAMAIGCTLVQVVARDLGIPEHLVLSCAAEVPIRSAALVAGPEESPPDWIDYPVYRIDRAEDVLGLGRDVLLVSRFAFWLPLYCYWNGICHVVLDDPVPQPWLMPGTRFVALTGDWWQQAANIVQRFLSGGLPG